MVLYKDDIYSEWTPNEKGAVRVAARAQRAGEDLVPGAGQGAGAVDLEGVGGAGRDVVAQGQAVQGGDDLLGQARPQALDGRGRLVAQGSTLFSSTSFKNITFPSLVLSFAEVPKKLSFTLTIPNET